MIILKQFIRLYINNTYCQFFLNVTMGLQLSEPSLIIYHFYTPQIPSFKNNEQWRHLYNPKRRNCLIVSNIFLKFTHRLIVYKSFYFLCLLLLIFLLQWATYHSKQNLIFTLFYIHFMCSSYFLLFDAVNLLSSLMELYHSSLGVSNDENPKHQFILSILKGFSIF